MGGHPHCGPNQ
jgi:hypothetical protein